MHDLYDREKETFSKVNLGKIVNETGIRTLSIINLLQTSLRH